jgi:glycosyltransferase involved in cell wall biosynthesis
MLLAWMDRFSLYFPDRLIPVSQKMQQKILSQLGIKARRVTTIRNAIPCEQFYRPEQRDVVRSEMGISHKAVVLGYTGRIQRVKRIDLLLDAFACIHRIHPDTHLIIAGEGEDRHSLAAYAETLGIADRITWTGFRRDVPRILSAFDIYVQSSLNEGLSLSILEAMAAGIPVVATDVGGNSEVIAHEVNGLLVPAGTTDEFVKAVLCLIEQPELREQFSSAGLNLMREEFSLNRMVNGYRALYKSVLEKSL